MTIPLQWHDVYGAARFYSLEIKMIILKRVVAGVAAMTVAMAMTIVSVVASDFGPAPSGFEDIAEQYIASRLEDPRGARVQFSGEPYKIFADIGSYEGLSGWAVDVRVKARMSSGSFGGYLPYTVIFIDGDPVALEEDAAQLTRL